MLATRPPTTQRAGSRPISFVLNDSGHLGDEITLTVRPEELTRNEPARASVHQTLGRGVQGWVDHFGEGMPSATIAGHTGWRYAQAAGRDGAEQFEALNRLVVHDFPAARQAAIDRGMDPGDVKLLFIDMLDGFAWSVVPMSFSLRRSKSRPLLFQYNMTMQAVSTSIDNPLASIPFFGNQAAGLRSLLAATSRLGGFLGTIDSLVGTALGFIDGGLRPIASVIKNFVGLSNQVFGAVNDAVRGARNFVSGVSNRLISIASDLAKVGLNVFRTISNIANLPDDIKARLARVASAYNEVACIFRNALRPRKTYEDYTGLYGASNCSSTTGGRPDSAYANMNAFAQMQPEPDVATVNSQAQAGISAMTRIDPVLAPMPIQEIGRHMTNVVTGIAF